MEFRQSTRLGGRHLRGSDLVWRADVREHREQVVMGSYVIPCHLSIGEDGNEAIHNIV